MRTNVILLLISAGLAVPTTLTMLSSGIEFTDQSEIPLLFAGFSPDNVETIRIVKARKDGDGKVVTTGDNSQMMDSLVMKRRQMVGEDDYWVFDGKDPDLFGVRVRAEKPREYVLEHIGSIISDASTLVAENATQEELTRFGLEKGNTEMVVLHLSDKAGKELAYLLVGRSTKESRKGKGIVRGYFVRRPDRTDVLLYERDYWELSTDKQQWVDRNIYYRFPIDQAVEVSLANVMGEVSFTKEKAEDIDWVMKTGPENMGAVRQAEVSALVATLQAMDAPRFYRPLAQGDGLQADLKALGLAEPSIRLEVRLQGGERKSLLLGKKVDGENYYNAVASTLPNYLLGIGDYQIHSFEAKPNKFFDPPAEAAIEKKEKEDD